MLVELGPVPATEVEGWTRIARRLITELRTRPGDLEGVVSDDLFQEWSRLIDEWAAAAILNDTFRWSRTLDAEVAEFLLHGLVRCYLSPGLTKRLTADEIDCHRPFTVHLIGSFVDGLAVEGRSCEHYVDGIRASLGNTLD